MAELGCKGSANFHTLQADIFDGAISSNHLGHLTGNYENLTHTPISDGDADAADADSGFTAIANSFHELAWDGDQAGFITLPNVSSKGNEIVVLHFTAPGGANGGQDLVITTGFDNSGNQTLFARQTLIFFTQNKGDKARLPKVIGMSANATGGQRRTTFNGRTHTTLTISATATDNQTNTGAELSFHYRVSGSMPGWHICFTGSEEGSGILNVKFNAGT